MRLPLLNDIPQTRQMVDTFGGYNHQPRIQGNEFYLTENTSCHDYPLLAPRRERGAYMGAAVMQGMLARNVLCYVAGGTLYINNLPVTGLTLTAGPKRLISMGAYIIIFPDKKWVNASKTTEYGAIEQTNSVIGRVSFKPSRGDGSDLDGNVTTNDTAPTNPEDGDYWIDLSGYPSLKLMRYSALSKTWTQTYTTFTRIEGTGIGAGLEKQDGVKISGIVYEGSNDKEKENLEALNGYNIVQYAGADYIVVTGILGWVHNLLATPKAPIVVSRTVPDMDYMCEADNRLWGCKYGLVDGEPVNEIYACRQGDFKNWRSFAGNAMDSYAASVGTDGPFTGAISYQGRPHFFKENHLHKVYGTMPANYKIESVALRGVQAGSGGSLAIVNELLVYKSRTDIMAFDGSMPQSISAQLGGELYHSAVAGAYKGRYYVSMRNDAWHLFVFDLKLGIWHREDSLEVKQFAQVGDELFAWTDTQVLALLGTEGALMGDIAWFAQGGVQGFETPDNKYVGRVNIRLKLEDGAVFSAFIRYDSEADWHPAGLIRGSGKLGTVDLPIMPRRCDHYELRFEGVGGFRVFSIAYVYEGGGDGP